MSANNIDEIVPEDALHGIEDGERVRVVTQSYEVTGTVTHLHEMDGWLSNGGLMTALSVDEADVDEGELLLGEDEGSDRLALASMRIGFEDEYVLQIEVVSE